jgi:hypothetical protein
MAEDSLSPKSQQAMGLVRAALHCTEELHGDPSLRICGLVAVLVHELSLIGDNDDRATALDTVHHDLDRLVPVAAAELAEAFKPTVN